MVAVIVFSLASSAKAETPKPMPVADLILDVAILKGKTVSVVGYTACVGQNGSMCMLYDSPVNFTKNIFFDASRMDRDDRSRIISCNILSACKVVLTGVVVDQPLKTMDIVGMDWGEGMTAPPQSQKPLLRLASEGAFSVKDFILDADQMRGKTVTVQGAAQCNGTFCWLSQTGWMSQQVVAFDAANLPRDDRKRLLECSQLLSTGCETAVTGTIGDERRLGAVSISWM